VVRRQFGDAPRYLQCVLFLVPRDRQASSSKPRHCGLITRSSQPTQPTHSSRFTHQAAGRFYGCRPHTASLPLAPSLRKSGCLGDACFGPPSTSAALLLQAARLYTASLPLAQSLRGPGCPGDAAGRFLRQPARRPPTDLSSASPLWPRDYATGLAQHIAWRPSALPSQPASHRLQPISDAKTLPPDSPHRQPPPTHALAGHPVTPTVLNMQPQSGISKRQAKKLDTKDRRRQARDRFEATQRQIRHSLLFQVPAEPRIYLAQCLGGMACSGFLRLATSSTCAQETSSFSPNSNCISSRLTPEPPTPSKQSSRCGLTSLPCSQPNRPNTTISTL
jgi:hypothetical protein